MTGRKKLEKTVAEEIRELNYFKDMFRDYQNNFPLMEIVVKYRLLDDTSSSSLVGARIALSRAFKPYFNKKTKEKIKKKHMMLGGLMSGYNAKIQKQGIHALTKKEREKVLEKATIKKGYHLWTEKEKRYFYSLLNNREYLRKDPVHFLEPNYSLINEKIKEKFSFSPSFSYMYKLKSKKN